MDQSIILLSLILFSGVITDNYMVEDPEEETPIPKPEEYLAEVKFNRSLNESAIQFMLQWLNKAQNVPRIMPEFFEKSDDSMIGDLFSQFNGTTAVAEIPHDPELRDMKPSTIVNMWFSEFGLKECLMHSEVRFYRDSPSAFRRAVNVTVYRVLGNQSEDQMIYVNSTILPASESGWFAVDITDCYKDWMSSPENNRGIKIVMSFPGEKSITVRPELVGIADFQADWSKHPFLVNFFDKSNASEGFFEKLFWEKLMSSATEAYERKQNEV